MQSMLIVDDQPDLRMLLRFTFIDSGFDVREAVDGEAALAACRTAMPDIVLLDVMMPGSTATKSAASSRPTPSLATRSSC